MKKLLSLQVYGDKDADGFFRGSCNNRMGYVPCNMVSEVQVDDPEIAAQLLQESQSSNSAETWDDGESCIQKLLNFCCP